MMMGNRDSEERPRSNGSRWFWVKYAVLGLSWAGAIACGALPWVGPIGWILPIIYFGGVLPMGYYAHWQIFKEYFEGR